MRIMFDAPLTLLFQSFPLGGICFSHAATKGLTAPLAQTFIAYDRRESSRSPGHTSTPSMSWLSGAGLACLMYRPSVSLLYQKVWSAPTLGGNLPRNSTE